MRVKWTIALAAIMAVAALGAVPATSAWATTPEFKVTKGKFPILFTSNNFNGFKFNTEERGEGVTCKTAMLEGHITGPKSVEGVYEYYLGCKGTFFGVNGECSNGEYAGERGIVTKELHGTIGLINKSTSPVGLELEGEAKSGEEPVFAEFTCTWLGATDTAQLRGHLIGQITTSLEKEVETLPIRYFGEKGKQEFSGFEGGPTGQQLTWRVDSGKIWNAGVTMENRFEFSPNKLEIL